ncbi:MAG TPA: hypothetical protein DCY20_06255 [Firmicutes bacterium]|nr:hypothetical protein [Bacillota bacterium]
MIWKDLSLESSLQSLLIDEENSINKLYAYAGELACHDPKKAQKLLERVLGYAKDHHLLRSEATILTILGYLCIDNGNYIKGIEYHARASSLFEELKDTEGVLKTCNGLMYMYFCLGMYDSSMDWATKGLNLAEETNNKKYLQILLTNIAQNYLMLKQYDEAKQVISSLKGIECEQSSVYDVVFQQIMAEIYLIENNLKMAGYAINQAIRLARHHNYERLLIECYVTHGKIKYALGQMNQVNALYEEIFKLTQKEEYIEVQMNALIDFGKMEVELGRNLEAETSLLQAYQIAEKLMMPIPFVQVSDCLIDLYKKQNKFETALHFLELKIEFEKQLETRKSELWAAKLKHEKSVSEAKLYKELCEEIFLISNIGRVLTSNLTYNELLKKMADELSNLMEVTILGLSEYEEESGQLNYLLFNSSGDSVDHGVISCDSQTSLGVYCIKNECTILMHDVLNEYTNYIPKKDRFKIIREGVQSVMMCPLLLNNKVKGFITVQSYQKSAYTNNDLNKLNLLASYVAVAFENAKLYRQTHYLATHDSLTGLLTRIEVFKKGQELYKQLDASNTLCVLMLDVDYFKKINDQYGHQVGDQVLVEMGNLLKNKVSQNITIGRYGGEEFLIFLNGYSEPECVLFANQLREDIAQLKVMINDEKTLNITASFGGYQFNKKEITLDKGIYYADSALYQSKHNGRNLVTFYA